MPLYPYSPELKAPGQWPALDFADAKKGPLIRMMVRELEERTDAFVPPAGCRMERRGLPLPDGEELGCFVFEPAERSAVRANLLYCHGGGFFLPVQPLMMKMAAELAEKLSLRVYLPQYRLLPEYRSPVPFTDCLRVLEELLASELPYLLYGESVGGTLAAGLSLWARDHARKGALAQTLVYPVLDQRCSRYASMRLFSEAAWPLGLNLRMWAEYLREGCGLDEAYIIPMKAESFAGLPPTYIEAQECDILRDEALAFGRLLEEAGTPTQTEVLAGSYHGFDEDFDNPFVRRAVGQRIDFMDRIMADLRP